MGFDELLFYGGLLLAGIFFLFGIIAAFLLKLQHMRLERKLDEEYGTAKRER